MLRSQSPSVWTSAQPEGEKPLVSAVGAGPVREIPPYSWGSHRSRLVDVLQEGHYDVKLDREDFERIVTWIEHARPISGGSSITQSERRSKPATVR